MKNAAQPSQVHAASSAITDKIDFTAQDARTAKILAGKATDTASQQERVLIALRTGPKSNTNFRALGIFQAPTRIFELRAKGYSIETLLYTGTDADGYTHDRLAMYVLNEPTAEELAQPASAEQADCPEYAAWMADSDKGSL